MSLVAQCCDAPVIELNLPDQAAVERLAGALAEAALPGDVIALWGALGLGKTTFARAFLHARPGGDRIAEVPSPTFTLVQLYALEGPAVWHFDLYRLKHPDEVWELGLEEALAAGITLIEWPDRAGPFLPADRLDLELSPGAGPESRRVRLTPQGSAGWAQRLAAIGESLDG